MENSGWQDILNSCNVNGNGAGSSQHYMDLSWQGNAGSSHVDVNNLLGFDNRIDALFGSASHEEHLMGGRGGGELFEYGQILQEGRHESGISSIPNTNISSEIMLDSCEMQPPKTGRRTHVQRVNHILAERQRREEMNEKFSILRSFIPKSIKRDKASIVAETINYVVEMEKTLKKLRACKAKRQTSPPPTKLRKSGASDAFQKLNIIGFEPNANIVEEPKMTRAQWKSGQVEVQELGSYAVIKITDKWKRGIVMQIHLALEECKVDVLQSNVTTIGDNIVQFTTIQMNPGATTNMKTIVDAIEKASTI